MSKRNTFFFLLIAAVFVAAAAIPINPNADLDYTISGTVKYNGYPLPGVVMIVSPGGAFPTNENGYYSATVSSGWSGIVTPTLLGYSFDPYRREYSNMTSNQEEQNYNVYTIMAGRNVNMVSVDPYRQRQNEPSLAVSTANPRHLLAGANDYSLVDFYGDNVDVTYDAWLGVFKSLDGGESWDHDLLPPFQGALLTPEEPPQPDESHPLFGYDAAADPTVRAGLNGWFYYSGIAFDREKNGDSVIFVCRYKDTGSDIVYVDTKIIDIGTSGQFSDKPWIAVDIPRSRYPKGHVYIVYSIFLGQIDPELNIHSKIFISKSTNGGDTWKKPVKVSESEQKNQGTTVAIDPNDGTVYVAWRRFPAVNVPHGILITKSENFGKQFTKAVEVATPLRPFDQDTIKGGQFYPAQFRTFAFPSMVVDQNGTIHIAWSQRDVDAQGFADDARIVIASQSKYDWGSGWTYVPVESPVTIPGFPNEVIHSHQFMPSLTCGAGKLMISWYDSRYSLRVFDEHGFMRPNYPYCPFGESTTDSADRIIDYWPTAIPPDPYSCDYRETIDVRAAQATPNPGYSLDIEESIQVSRYIWVLEEDEQTGGLIPIQGQFNPPNYKLFAAGTAPFHGDYLDIVSAPQLVKENNVWRFSDVGDPLVYYVAWTDNRDVLPPNHDLWNIYTPYPPAICTDEPVVGMRNQNIYVSKLAPEIEVGVLGQYERYLDGVKKHDVFVIYVENETGTPFEDPDTEPQHKTFQLNIVPEGAASFFPDEPLPGTEDAGTIVVDVPDHSSISRMVFVTPPGTYPIEVQIIELDTGDFADSVVLSPGDFPIMRGGTSITEFERDYINWADPPYNPLDDSGNPILPNPNIITPNIITPNIITPNIITPNIITPNIITPNIITPNIITPNIITPNIITPNIITSNILTMSILNPNIITANILTTPPDEQTEVVDKIWTVTNNTNAVSSYTFKSIAGDSLPEDLVYLHLLIFKVHTIPSTDGCALENQVQHELLVNISPPEVIYTVDPEEIAEVTGDPHAEFENATFSLGPNEEGLVILRVIDTHKPRGQSSSQLMTAQGESTEPDEQTQPSTEAESFASNLGGLAVSHTSTEGSPEGAITLMILPDSLPNGQAGKYYYVALNVIGGTEPYEYIWDFDSAKPAGLNIYPSTGVISGIPREAWNSPVTVIVTESGETDTHVFSLFIDDPEPLIIAPNLDPPYNATKNSPYNGLTFAASGGVPFYGGEPLPGGGQLYIWTLIGAPAGLSLQHISSSEGVEIMELKGTPTEADNFSVTVEVNDNYITHQGGPNRPVKIPFNLCVRPAEPFELIPLHDGIEITCDISNPTICPLPAGELGEEYGENNVTLVPKNNEQDSTLEWVITDGSLPPGLAFNPPLGETPVVEPASIAIEGSPTYEGDPNYPKPYEVTVMVTEIYDFDGGCAGFRSAEKTLAIMVNPKGKAWAIQESELEGAATAIAAAVDGSGNVYVTGYMNDAKEGKNYYTIKYPADDSPSWQVSYNGPGKADDIPSAIAIDATSVYVTGTSEGRRSGLDIYTVKYDLLDGHVIWEERYDGPSHLGDEANAMALDTANDVLYVAGFVRRGKQEKHADYCTLKYDSNSGELLWDRTYDSRRNGKDYATAVAFDSSENVYVTGMSQESLTKEETTFDYLTLKYDRTGSLQYEVRDDGPGFGNDEPTAIVFDGGHLYVTGLTTGGTLGADYYTVKYNAELNPLWENLGKTYKGKTYNGPGNGDDVPSAIAVDSSGNVYVTGKSLGNDGDNDYATIKYDSSGGLGWSGDGAVRFNGGQGNDEAVAIAVDDADGTCIYVGGFVTTDTRGVDYFVINYNDAGSIIWVARYPLPDDEDYPQGDEFATAMTTDATGIYMTGYSVQSGISRFATVKFIK